jgi:hypothetical protein
MTAYTRKFPFFSLCGLNCGLCPRYQTGSVSKCPGCGGPDFHLKHPSCAVITCNKKHDAAEYCFQCSSYPCDRFCIPSKQDSFISYKNVISDFAKAKRQGIEKYQEELRKKIEICETLIANYNDGKRKSFYCLAANLLSLSDLEEGLKRIEKEIPAHGKDAARSAVELIESVAKKRKIELRLRK